MRKCKACGLQFYTTDPTKELCHCCDEALKRLGGYAVPVVHGRWIDQKIDNFRMWELRCSECDWVGISNYDAYDEPYDFNYCPHCGAKMMDGGNEDG